MGTQQERLSSASFQNHWYSIPTHSLLEADVTAPGSAGLETTHGSLISSFSAFACLAPLLDWVKHVCVRTCIHTCVQTCICTCVHTHACGHMCIHVYTCAHMGEGVYVVACVVFTHVCVHICTHAHTCTHGHMCLCVHVHVSTCVHVHVFTCVRVCVRMCTCALCVCVCRYVCMCVCEFRAWSHPDLCTEVLAVETPTGEREPRWQGGGCGSEVAPSVLARLPAWGPSTRGPRRASAHLRVWSKPTAREVGGSSSSSSS